jgi:hypothetical protein
MLSQWDLNLLAKVYPGVVDAPYVAAMGLPPLPTSTFKVGFSLNTVYDKDRTPAAD